MQTNNHTHSNISALFEGLKFLNMLDETHYQASFKPAFQATIGAHFRHVIEHYQCFFKQLDKQHFCYDLRSRNVKLEIDLEYAKTTISEIITTLQTTNLTLTSSVLYLSDETINTKIETSLLRELAFLQSHTTHHYAIIAAIARSLGLQPHDDFGVAIATRNHHEMLQDMEQKTCVR